MTGKVPLICGACSNVEWFDITKQLPNCTQCRAGHYRSPTKSELKKIKRKAQNDALQQ